MNFALLANYFQMLDTLTHLADEGLDALAASTSNPTIDKIAAHVDAFQKVLDALAVPVADASKVL